MTDTSVQISSAARPLLCGFQHPVATSGHHRGNASSEQCIDTAEQTDFVFVRYHDVAEAKQFDGKLCGRRWVEDRGCTLSAPGTKRIGDCVERYLKLAEHNPRRD